MDGFTRAQAFEGGLNARIIRHNPGSARRQWLALLVEEGMAERRDTSGPETFEAPFFLWQAWSAGMRVILKPGASGAYALFDVGALEGALGIGQQEALLRQQADMPFLVRPAAATLKALRHALAEISRHLEQRDQTGQRLAEAHLRVLLLEAARKDGVQPASVTGGAHAKQVSQRFTQYIETHFRTRPSVAQVAEVIGVSTDRLHDICRREYGTTPKKLMNKRICIEARVMLERSGQSIERVAEHLGFGTASQFNRFFRLHTGVTPGRLRRRAFENAQRESDWLGLDQWP